MCDKVIAHARDRTATDIALRPAQLRLAFVTLSGHIGLPVGASRFLEGQIRRSIWPRYRRYVRVVPRVALGGDVGGVLLGGLAIHTVGNAGVAIFQALHLHDAWFGGGHRYEHAGRRVGFALPPDP